eukprot:3909688-Alexandrium_andersonii.AAC.1
MSAFATPWQLCSSLVAGCLVLYGCAGTMLEDEDDSDSGASAPPTPPEPGRPALSPRVVHEDLNQQHGLLGELLETRQAMRDELADCRRELEQHRIRRAAEA